MQLNMMWKSSKIPRLFPFNAFSVNDLSASNWIKAKDMHPFALFSSRLNIVCDLQKKK